MHPHGNAPQTSAATDGPYADEVARWRHYAQPTPRLTFPKPPAGWGVRGDVRLVEQFQGRWFARLDNRPAGAA